MKTSSTLILAGAAAVAIYLATKSGSSSQAPATIKPEIIQNVPSSISDIPLTPQAQQVFQNLPDSTQGALVHAFNVVEITNPSYRAPTPSTLANGQKITTAGTGINVSGFPIGSPQAEIILANTFKAAPQTAVGTDKYGNIIWK